ncbi:hypothetical protein DES49_2677 [Halospina denitrificans]|uniref:Uncharacterized protein n=1 Tax=Halospina denitrificans TaxID=332522 RepID=A0A4R7JM05_9GAMM|nr:hypothetical protein [Halospina denitrificans]TDT37719.1 hypothetical protein DES49_2677 [Halospina denitrificans]
MRFSESMRFPHPVLAPWSDDLEGGHFEVAFTVSEDTETGALNLYHEIELTQPDIKSLLMDEKAEIGFFVRCNDTYFSDLRHMSWPKGRNDFAAGKLLNNVSLRPCIWLKDDLENWSPEYVHHEFEVPINLPRSEIIAIGEEFVISVGKSKLSPLESIFELDSSKDIEEGKLEVILDRDRITILTAPETHEVIRVLRERTDGSPVVMNSVYLPAVMDVLDGIKEGGEQYEGKRWYQPFMAKCDSKGIDPASHGSMLERAQTLLEFPTSKLAKVMEETT